MAMLLDGLMVLLFGLCVLSGWKRGFIKVFSGLIALVAATLVSTVLSPVVAVMVARYSSLALPLLRLLCSMVLFLLVYTVAKCLLRWLDVVAKLPLIKQLNQVLGLVVGVLSGALWVLFAMGVVTALAWLGWVPAITPAVLKDTVLISWLSALATSLV